MVCVWVAVAAMAEKTVLFQSCFLYVTNHREKSVRQTHSNTGWRPAGACMQAARQNDVTRMLLFSLRSIHVCGANNGGSVHLQADAAMTERRLPVRMYK